MEHAITDENIEKQLTKLLSLIEENDNVKRYKALEKKIQDNKKLTILLEEIKKAQKDAVQFAHYGKAEAEKQALIKADSLTKEFDEHPLVVAYREQLLETNDLLHYITEKIQYQLNEELEKEG